MKDLLTNKGLQTFTFENKVEKFSVYQPIDIKPRVGIDYILNSKNNTNNANYITYKDAYEDSPTNSSILNDIRTYMYGEGLIDEGVGNVNLKQYMSPEDVLLTCKDDGIYGGFSVQVIWNEQTKTPLKIKYIPIYKLGIKYNQLSLEVEGYWFSYDWDNNQRYRPELYPRFTGQYTEGQNLEILLVRQPTAEPFFAVPDYFSCIPFAKFEGGVGNYADNYIKNSAHDIIIVNYNQGRQATPELARSEAEKVRDRVTGTDNTAKVVVSFNDSIEESVTFDKLPPSNLSENITFFTEEAERKIKVGHGMPNILFSGNNQGGGFSNNADEYSMALKIFYRKKINPRRQNWVDGIKQITDLIDSQINPWFKDFKEETELDNNDNIANLVSVDNALVNGDTVSLDEKTLDAQASLKGSVGGVQALLEIQNSYSSGTTTYESAIAMLDLIFGYDKPTAVRLLGQPKIDTTT